MRPPLAAVFLALLSLSASVPARANDDADAPLAAVRSSLQALKAPDASPEKSKAALAVLSASAARLKPAPAPAVAALGRLKNAVAAAASAEAKDLPEKLKQVNARGDELLAALEGNSPAGQVARRFPAPDENRIETAHADARNRALKVANAGFETSPGPGVVAAVGPTLTSPGSGGVAYVPVALARPSSDLGIPVPGPQPSVAETGSGFKIFAAAFEPMSYAPAAQSMMPYMMMKLPGMPSDALPQVARASQYTAENFLMHLDIPAYIQRPGLDHPEAFATPAYSVKSFGIRAPVPTPANVKASANFSGTTIEPTGDGIIPVPSRAKAVQIVTAGGSFAVSGLPQASASVSVSNLGNPLFKGELAGLADGLVKVNAFYREAGGTGNMSRSRGAGFTYQASPDTTFFGSASMNDRPGSLHPKQTTSVNLKAGLSVALNSAP